jgi:formylglycine-generating enzyme required for sulfatase activity
LRLLICFIFIFTWVSACAPTSKKHRKRYRKAYTTNQSVPKQKPKTSRSEPIPRPTPPIKSSLVKTTLLPTIMNEQDQSLMILIRAGKYLVGKERLSIHKKLNKKEVSFLNLAAFYIDRTEITVTQFRKYQSHYNEKLFTNGKDCPNCPAMGINWIQASKYCLWAGKRLPQEEEWEAAARGANNFSYPWGKRFLSLHSNLLGKEDGYLFSAPVGSFLSGASASGLVDMAGNVWEWVDKKQSARSRSKTRIVKGGGWTSNKDQARISFRNHVDLKMNNPTFGFRCAKSLVQKR